MSANPELTRRFLTFRNFPEVVGELVRAEASLAGVTFAVGRPKDAAQVPHIWCRRIRRTPGMDGVETRGGRLRDSFKRSDGTVTELTSQWMTCIFQFDICAGSSDEAERYAGRFEQLLKHAKGTLLSLGLSVLVFEEELEDHLLPGTKDIEVRSLRYLARFDDVDASTTAAIQEIRLRVLEAFDEGYEVVVRGETLGAYDLLTQTYVSEILCVSAASQVGIARTADYVLGVDYVLLHDPISQQLALQWERAGKHPEPGATYYVRYRYWSDYNPRFIRP